MTTNKVKITIDKLLLLLFDAAEIAVEKLDGNFTKILLEDYATGDIYVLSTNILWELLYAKGYLRLTQEASYPHRMNNNKIISKTQQIYSISDHGKNYIKFKYPGIRNGAKP